MDYYECPVCNIEFKPDVVHEKEYHNGICFTSCPSCEAKLVMSRREVVLTVYEVKTLRQAIYGTD